MAKITIGPGWNDITWPVNAASITNEQVLEDLNKKGFRADAMQKHKSGGLAIGEEYPFRSYGGPGPIWQMVAESGTIYRTHVNTPLPLIVEWEVPGTTTIVNGNGNGDDNGDESKLSDFVKSIRDWAEKNSILAGVIGIGGFLLLTGGLKIGRK